ncbi:MAG: hypothetical protein ACR2QF_08435 [Geminicoccaceae bacterium]
MKRLMITVLAGFAAISASVAGLASGALADSVKRVAIHVDENDPKRMNMALNNAANIFKHYEETGETVEVRLVANGPGLHMLREDTSPVKDRVAAMALEHESLSFAACGNTHRMMSKQSGGEITLVSEAEMISSGVVELIELQGEGWAYIRP